MKKLILKLSVLLLLVIFTLSLLLLAPYPSIDSYHLYYKKHAALNKINGKKILFIGGSGVFYSVDAGLIEKQIDGYAVYNMGFSAGLGLEYNFNEIKQYVKTGDIIVSIPEHSNFKGGKGSVVTLLAINSLPLALKTTSREHLKFLLQHYGLVFIPIKCENYLNDLVLYMTKSAPTISHNGDILVKSAKRDVSKMPLNVEVDYDSVEYKNNVKLINDFNSYCKHKGANVVLSFSSIPEPHFDKNKSKLNLLYEHLLNDVTVPILYGPEVSVYPLDLFDDTVYHMNAEGRILNSLKLIKSIESIYPQLFPGRLIDSHN